MYIEMIINSLDFISVVSIEGRNYSVRIRIEPRLKVYKLHVLFNSLKISVELCIHSPIRLYGIVEHKETSIFFSFLLFIMTCFSEVKYGNTSTSMLSVVFVLKL